jgi:hypothetical protein
MSFERFVYYDNVIVGQVVFLGIGCDLMQSATWRSGTTSDG